MFHHLHDETHPPGGQGSISGDTFEEALNFIGTENILGPDEWISRLKNNRLRRDDVCITFDDALRCQYDICAPILKRLNLRCFWFVYSSVFEDQPDKLEIYRFFRVRHFDAIDDFYGLFFLKIQEGSFKKINENRFKKYLHEASITFPFYSFNDLKFRFLRDEVLQKGEYEELMDAIIEERAIDIKDISRDLWLTAAQLKDLSSDGHAVGLHSYSHPTVLANLSYSAQMDEYKKNLIHIKKICNREVLAMSHPCNSYNDATSRILKKLGIICGFRSNMVPPKGKRINPSFLEIAREDHSNIVRQVSK